MEVRTDPQPQIEDSIRFVNGPALWWAGWADPGRARTDEPDARPSSSLAECECPDDCLRDHDAE
jgi:hypothetical protein